MNQLDIYLNKEVEGWDLRCESSKLVVVREILEGQFNITEISNGEIRHYQQRHGEEPILFSTIPCNKETSDHPKMILSILNDVMYRK